MALHTFPASVQILICARLIRHFAYGLTSLILVLFLTSLGYPEFKVGIFMSCTLLGDVLISFFLAAATDRIGRRRVMVAGGLLMTGSGLVFAFCENYWLLLVASSLGVINPR